MSDAKPIGFEQIGLAGVLRRYKLSVPPNQREYSWTDREVLDLLQDFAKAIGEPDSPSYFLGTVVTVAKGEGELEVVDGQQRLATTAILLRAIADALRVNDAEIATSIDNDFLCPFDREKRDKVPRLRLNLVDNDYFKARLSTPGPFPAPTRSSHQLIASAFVNADNHVKAIVSALNERDHGDALNKWIRFLEYRALVVLLTVPNSSDAFKMFETLNDRGLKTTQTDLVKNYLLARSGERSQEVHEKWAYMRGALEALEDDDITLTFLRHALIVIQGFTRAAEIYERVQKQAKSEQSVITFATNLEVMANAYVAIHNPEHEKWNGYPEATQRAIKVLNVFAISPLRPLMLAVAIKFSEPETSKAFQAFISWGVRLIIAASTRSGSVEIPLAEAAKDVHSGKINTTVQLQKKLKGTIPGDEQFKAAFETASVSKALLARYYLRSLESVAQGVPEPWLIPNDDKTIINLEHVLPKKPMENWPQFDEEAVQLYTNRIGNLALLTASANSDIRSGDFQAKKALYAISPYVLTSQIAEVENWTPGAIISRQKIMAPYALRAWPL